MTDPNAVKPQQVFDIVDSMDVGKFVALFAESARLTFGNVAPAEGLDAIRDVARGFFDTIAGLHHNLVRVWQIGADTIVHLDVDYQRKDGGRVSLPCVTIYHLDDNGKVDDYRVFADLTPIYL